MQAGAAEMRISSENIPPHIARQIPICSLCGEPFDQTVYREKTCLKCAKKTLHANVEFAVENVRLETESKAEAKAEKEMHEQFTSWLRVKALPFVHSRMDRKSTIQEGWPDFTVILPDGRVMCIEFKMPGKALDSEQVKRFAELAQVKCPALVCYSFTEAMHAVLKQFVLNEQAEQ